MSNHHDLYCVTCDDYPRRLIWANHGDIAVRMLARELAKLVAIDDAIRAFHAAVESDHYAWLLGVNARMSLGESGTEVSALAAWARKHVGHDVRMRDEYGTVDGFCDKRYTCNGGCELVRDHAEPCGPAASSEVSP